MMTKKYEKTVLILVCLFLWIFLYFFINDISVNRNVHVLPTIIEDKIPLVASFVFIYLSCYLLVFMPIFFLKNLLKFKKAVYSYLIVIIISAAVFLIYPIKIIRPEIIVKDLSTYALSVLYAVDKPYNTLPSLHVALSFLSSFIVFNENKKYGSLFIVWAFLVAIAALFIKQHYILDVIIGALTAFAVFILIAPKSL